MNIEDIENYDDLFDIIDDNEDMIEEEYHGKDDQILIHKDLIKELLDYLSHTMYDQLDKNKALKVIVRDALELSMNDIIIIKKGYLFIKLYNEEDRYVATEEEKNTAKNRYNGISEEDLKDFYDEYFSLHEIEELFYDTAEELVEKYFLDTHISNYAYEKEIFKIVQKMIAEDYKMNLSVVKSFQRGFQGIFLENTLS